jgi:hypothetical protein
MIKMEKNEFIIKVLRKLELIIKDMVANVLNGDQINNESIVLAKNAVTIIEKNNKDNEELGVIMKELKNVLKNTNSVNAQEALGRIYNQIQMIIKRLGQVNVEV